MELRDIIKEAPAVDEHATFREVVETMIRRQANSLLVVNDTGEFVGEVGVSDLMDAIVPDYLDGDSIGEHFATEESFRKAVEAAADKEAADFMSMDANPIRIDDSIMTVAAAAIGEGRARLPVIDQDGRPVGIISRRGLKHMLGTFLGIHP